MVATILYLVATLAFVVGGGGLLAEATWTRPMLVWAAILSSAAVVLFWEGGMPMAMQKGLIGLLINVALLIVLWSGRFPTLAPQAVADYSTQERLIFRPERTRRGRP